MDDYVVNVKKSQSKNDLPNNKTTVIITFRLQTMRRICK